MHAAARRPSVLPGPSANPRETAFAVTSEPPLIQQVGPAQRTGSAVFLPKRRMPFVPEHVAREAGVAALDAAMASGLSMQPSAALTVR